MVGGPAELLPKRFLGIEQRGLGARVPHQDAANGARLQVGKVHKALQEGGLLVAYFDLQSRCVLGYSDFHNFMRFTSKKMLNNILKNVC
jgi:hypothetical protein